MGGAADHGVVADTPIKGVGAERTADEGIVTVPGDNGVGAIASIDGVAAVAANNHAAQTLGRQHAAADRGQIADDGRTFLHQQQSRTEADMRTVTGGAAD